MGTFGATCVSWTYPKYPRNPGILRHGDLWCYLCVLDLPQVSQESRDTPTWGPLVLHMCLEPIPSIPGIPGYSDMGTFGATCASWTYPKYPRNPRILRHGDLWCYLCVLDLSHVSQESWDTPTWGPLVLHVRLGPIPGIPGYSDIIILCILSDIATCMHISNKVLYYITWTVHGISQGILWCLDSPRKSYVSLAWHMHSILWYLDCPFHVFHGI